MPTAVKRIMVVGDPAAGKSTFAKALSSAWGLPLIHTDLIRYDEAGIRRRNDDVRRRLLDVVRQEHWVIDGNVLAADPTERVKRADMIFLFDFPKLVTLFHLVGRWCKTKLWLSHRLGFYTHNRESFYYYLPYIFKRFPRRKADFRIEVSKYPSKEFIVFSNRRQVTAFLRNSI